MVRDRILAETHRAKLEAWMEELVERRVAEDPRIGHAEKLLEMAIRAREGGGTIIFWGD